MASDALHALLAVNGGPLESRYEPLVQELASLSQEWISECSSDPAWKAVINSQDRLAHELEDAVVPLQEVVDTLLYRSPSQSSSQSQNNDDSNPDGDRVTIVDLCAGKAFIALTVLGLATRWPDLRSRLGAIAVVEKSVIAYEHISDLAKKLQVPLFILSGENIHDEAFVCRLVQQLPNNPVGLVAVHLCGRLSSRAIELFNLLGDRCRFLFLAPCCMPSGVPPRRGQPTVSVQLGEFPEEELQVQTEKELRKLRWQRSRDLCWRCGVAGHARADCAAPDSAPGKFKAECKARATKQIAQIDLLQIGASTDPFSAWVDGLLGVVAEKASTRQVNIALGTHDIKDIDLCEPGTQKDWHDGRKGSWILASR